MAYVGDPFVHDIFVSYSHGDVDGTGTSRLQRWSQAFARELEGELKSQPPEFSSAVRLFLDQNHRPSQGIDPLQPLTAQLQADIEKSAILLILMSPQYLASQWCTRERDWWRGSRRTPAAEDGCIAVVRIQNTPDPWPVGLVDGANVQLPGFWFFDRERAPQLQRPFGWPEPVATNEQFQQALINLVGQLYLQLGTVATRLRQEREAREHTARLAATSGQAVYLHGRVDSKAAWESAATALTDSGLVVSNDPDPVVSDPKKIQDIRGHRVGIMKECDAVLIVADPNPAATDADLIVVGKHDCNSARALSNRPLPCALLNGVGDQIATARRKNAARSFNVGWIDLAPPPPPWVQSVQEWLTAAAAQED